MDKNIWLIAGCGSTAPDNAAIASVSSYKAVSGKKSNGPRVLTASLASYVSDLPAFRDSDPKIISTIREGAGICANNSDGQLWILVGCNEEKPNGAVKIRNLKKIK